MDAIIIKTSQNGTTFTNLKTPSSFKINFEDLDNDSYRSVTNGNLIRNRISAHWKKLELSYNCVSNDELNTIAAAINTNQEFWVQCICPAFGTNNWVTFKGYCSQFNAEMLQKQVGWSLSFNIIESQR